MLHREVFEFDVLRSAQVADLLPSAWKQFARWQREERDLPGRVWDVTM
jgi:hypothetical protein